MAVVNDPRADNNRSWWGWGPAVRDLSWADPPPPLDPTRYPNYKLKDLEPYLRIVRGSHQQFLRDRASLTENLKRQLELGFTGFGDDDGPARGKKGYAQAMLDLSGILRAAWEREQGPWCRVAWHAPRAQHANGGLCHKPQPCCPWAAPPRHAHLAWVSKHTWLCACAICTCKQALGLLP